MGPVGHEEPAARVWVTGFGSLVVPCVPFVLTFRPPRFLIEHQGRAVAFGPSPNGLGCNPMGGATVEDVTLDIVEYPPVPVLALRTEHVHFPIEAATKVYSTPNDTPWPFELQLEGAPDADEMLHVRGPLPGPVDLGRAPDTLRPVADGRIDKPNGLAIWREWEYAHLGRAWRQRLYAVGLRSTHDLDAVHHFAVTAQCDLARRDVFFPFSDRLVFALGSSN